jgi:hypothetical protein
MRHPAALVILALTHLAGAQDTTLKKPLISSGLGGRELTFLTSANENGVLLNYLAETAKAKASGEQFRAVADLLGSTQQKENDRLVQLAANKGKTFPAQTPATLKKIQAKLEPLSGPEFDAACGAEFKRVLDQVAANCELGAKAADPDIKAFAEQGLAMTKDKLGVVNKLVQQK